MKKLWFSFALLVLFMLGNCAPAKYVPNPNEELYGTWINRDISPQETMNFAGGFKDFTVAGETVVYGEGNEQITSKRKDDDGNIFYTTTDTGTSGVYVGYKWQALQKLSKSGKREFVANTVNEFSDKNYPTKIDPKNSYYRVYYREEK